MLKPTCAQIEELAQEYTVIPVCKEIYADVITPITLLRKLLKGSKRCFLLESIEGGERWARYSFLGYDPTVRVTCKNGLVTVDDGEPRLILTRKPLDTVRELLGGYRAPRLEGLPPFTGGLVGYFSYEMIGYAEPVLKLKSSDVNDFDLMLFDKVIAYDHLSQKLSIVVNMKSDRVMENYGLAVAEIENIVRLILDPAPLPEARTSGPPQFACSLTREQFCGMVDKCKGYIENGDIFQAVLSRRFTCEYKDSLLNAYRVLRTTNPSPYMVFLQIDDTQIISSSPETLVKLQDGRLSTFPIAGSRPRGATAGEDAALEKELLADAKELAEHNMLVDLGRNDLGRIARYGSVEVAEYQQIRKYSRIMHIASLVEADIRPEFDACSAIEALLPAGTLSGAPKIRACEIIAELEGAARGVYGGAIGYIDFTGNMDMCIAIRMAVRKNGKLTVQAGGGIVADSVPGNEYIETENKAGAVINAIRRAGEVDG